MPHFDAPLHQHGHYPHPPHLAVHPPTGTGAPWPQPRRSLSNHRPKLSRWAWCLVIGGACTLSCCVALVLLMLLGVR